MRAILFILASLLSQPVFAVAIDGARLWPSPDNTRLVLDLNGPVEHRVFVLQNPSRVVVDISEATLSANLAGLDLNNSGISRIRSALRQNGDLRVVLDLSAELTPRSFSLKPNEQYGHRLVLDLERPPGLSMEPQERQVTQRASDLNEQRRNIVVAIDAGHGGEDPGAIGRNLYEKNVVLAIARELYNELNEIPGYEPFLVRTGDYYISLHRRRELARENNADLFVSIHADAFTTAQPSGISVFALSTRGASSAMAQFLANQENEADVIGGIYGISLQDKDEVLRSVLVDLSMTATLRTSMDIGNSVLGEMKQIARPHKTNVEQAGFAVLRSPDVPSLLIETGFISNARDEANLGSASHRRQLASAIRTGIVNWFTRNPPPGTLIAWQQRNANEVRRYTVVRGDTLSGIAARNGTSVSRLREMNQLNGTSIRIGQVLMIPGA